jgi:hypothetical protein
MVYLVFHPFHPCADSPSAPEIVALLPQLTALVTAAREWAKAQGHTEEGEGQAGQKEKPVANGSAAAHDVEWARGALASLQADMEQVRQPECWATLAVGVGATVQLHCKHGMVGRGMGC